MILGFAHITRNRPFTDGGFLIANAPEKWPLMAMPAKAHRLLFPHDRIREETVEYDTGVVDQPGRIEVDSSGIIWLLSQDRERERRFWCDALGFRPHEDSGEIIRLVSPVPVWSVTLNVIKEPSAPLDPPLDIAGYAALAFYSSNVEADRDRAIAAGGRTPTDPFTVKLDREMKIIMLRSPEGTIIELIEVKP